MAVADALDAMTSGRRYRAAVSLEAAFAEADSQMYEDKRARRVGADVDDLASELPL